ncbi:MAG: DUF2793 domain-containing protein [Pacificimonas sp.]
MGERTARLGLPLMQAAQAQKELTHNAALHDVDRWLNLRLESRTVTVPPIEPDAGRSWLVPAEAADDWAGHDGEIARHDGEGWRFDMAPAGLLAWVADENAVLLCRDHGWNVGGFPVSALTVGGRIMLAVPPAAVQDPDGGANVDVEARQALSALLNNLRDLGLVSP